jgi:hypothetical protein
MGHLGAAPLRLEAHGFNSGMESDSTTIGRSHGRGAFAITGLTAGAAAVDATAEVEAGSGAAEIDTVVNDSIGQTGNILASAASVGAGNVQDIAATTLIDRGVTSVFLAISGGGPSAAAHGLAFSDLGFSYAAAGDIEGLTVRTDYHGDVRYWGAELRLAADAPLAGGWVLSPFAGPIYRSFRHDLATVTHISVSEGPLFRDAAPDAVLALDEELEGDHFGAVLGAGVRGQLTSRIGLDLSVAGALTRLWADYEGRRRASADFFPAGGVASRTFTGPGIDDSESKAVFLGRAKGAVVFDLGFGALSLGGQAEYLSDVPTVEWDDPAAATAARAGGARRADASAERIGPIRPTAGLGFDDMWIYGAEARLSVRF